MSSLLKWSNFDLQPDENNNGSADGVFSTILITGLIFLIAQACWALYTNIKTYDQAEKTYWFFSLIIYLFFVLWQLKGLTDFIRKPSSSLYKRIVYSSTIYLGLALVTLWVFSIIFYHLVGFTSVNNFLIELIGENMLLIDQSLISTLWIIFLVFGLSYGLAGVIAIALMFGRIGLGATVCLAFNTYMISGQLDFSKFYDIALGFIFEGIGDIPALSIAVVWATISSVLSKR